MLGPKFGQCCNHLKILMCCLITNLAVPRFFVEVFLSSIVTYGMRTWAPKIFWFTFLLDYYLETIKNVLFSGPTIFPNVFQVGPEKNEGQRQPERYFDKVITTWVSQRHISIFSWGRISAFNNCLEYNSRLEHIYLYINHTYLYLFWHRDLD